MQGDAASRSHSPPAISAKILLTAGWHWTLRTKYMLLYCLMASLSTNAITEESHLHDSHLYILENNFIPNSHKHEDNRIPGKGRVFMKPRYFFFFLILSMSAYKNRCM